MCDSGVILKEKLDANHSLGSKGWKNGSILVSEQLPTYPSPTSTTVNWQQVKVDVGLGEGKVGSCPDTDIDPQSLHFHKFEFLVSGPWYVF